MTTYYRTVNGYSIYPNKIIKEDVSDTSDYYRAEYIDNCDFSKPIEYFQSLVNDEPEYEKLVDTLSYFLFSTDQILIIYSKGSSGANTLQQLLQNMGQSLNSWMQVGRQTVINKKLMDMMCYVKLYL